MLLLFLINQNHHRNVLMTRFVSLNMESVSMDSAVALECTLATESTAEVRKQTFTEMRD